MAGTVTYQCPNCDAGLTFNAEKQKFCCEFCLSEFTEAELAATATAAHAEEVLEEEAEFKEVPRTEADDEYSSHMNAYQCPNCGAEIVADESTAADYCYYCHNPVILVGKLAGEMAPKKVIPFQISQEKAEEIFLKWAGSKKFVPNDFFSKEHAQQIRGIYFPFWVTDADIKGTADGSATKSRSYRRGDYRYTETSHFKIHRAGEIHFEDIVTSALSEADKKMLEGVLPYPADVHKDFSMAYLSGFVAKKRDLSVKDVGDEVRDRMNRYTGQILRKTVEGYHTVSLNQVKVNVRNSNWNYTLMPIWILTYKDKKDKVYTFALNGYTGKIYGELPISLRKMAILAASTMVPIAVACSLIGGLAFG